METRDCQPVQSFEIGGLIYRGREVSPDCDFDVQFDAGDLHLICLSSMRIYSMTPDEARAFARTILRRVDEAQSDPAHPDSP